MKNSDGCLGLLAILTLGLFVVLWEWLQGDRGFPWTPVAAMSVLWILYAVGIRPRGRN
jgi:hypothetical protein